VPDPPLPEPLQRALATGGVEKLYSHQVEVLRRCRNGESVVVTTATASGKTLAFNLPVFETMLTDSRATALYLYPMKAVTQDQFKVLKGLEKAVGLSLNPAVYDGDTPQEKRPGIRRRSRVVLSNPYELHQVLPYHYKWLRFLSNLRWVIVDEAHRYRGVFGSNVAQLLRRLRRVCRLYGRDPQFVMASASIANPQELAQRLTGKEFSHVGDDGSPHGRGWLVFWNPLSAPDVSVPSQIREVVRHFASTGFQTLCFVPSRRQAELVSRWVRESAPELAVSPYRAGYLPEDRRRIESDLSSGNLRGVVSTDALELGVDIGGLDCIVIAAYPGSFASFWQQAGRAGRKLQDSVVVFIGSGDALNQYLLRNPGIVLDRSFESAVVDLHNPYILSGHLLCAASESPLRPDEITPEQVPIVQALEERKELGKTPVGWIYAGRARPQEVVTLGAIEEHAVDVVCDGKVIETLDRSRACRDAHPGAVLFHQGDTYLVKSLDLDGRRAEVEHKDVDYYTGVIQQEDLKLLDTLEERTVGSGIRLAFGRLQVTEKFIGYRVKRYDQILSTHPLDLPPVEFPTVGVRLEFEAAGVEPQRHQEHKVARFPSDTSDFVPLCLRGESSPWFAGFDFTGGMHGAEHALIAIAPLIAMCDPRDFGGASYPVFPDTRKPTILIYDGYENGIGISEKLYAEFGRWTRVALDLVVRCGCDEGCPACVLSPRCGDNNQPMDKRGAIAILKLLAGG
jgi:DEAD/DEAH box helicase domain-containing protein